jgi:hypothetical protein
MDRLMRQRQASAHTIASYRDSFRLLMQYAQQRMRKAPSPLTVPDIDIPFLGAFLDHLEKERDNSARSRNVRLAALHFRTGSNKRTAAAKEAAAAARIPPVGRVRGDHSINVMPPSPNPKMALLTMR